MQTYKKGVRVMTKPDDKCRTTACTNPTDGEGEDDRCGSCADRIETARRSAEAATEEAEHWDRASLAVQQAFIAVTEAVDALDALSEARNGRAAAYVPDAATDAVREQVFRATREVRQANKLASDATARANADRDRAAAALAALTE